MQTTPGKETVVTTDLLVEDIDFRRTTIPPYLLGHKALAVSLSDIAAMGRGRAGRSFRSAFPPTFGRLILRIACTAAGSS